MNINRKRLLETIVWNRKLSGFEYPTSHYAAITRKQRSRNCLGLRYPDVAYIRALSPDCEKVLRFHKQNIVAN
jgi:hypothetical protein